MKVILKQKLFTPVGRFRPAPKGFPIELPDEVAQYLPSSAKVVEGPNKEAPVELDPVDKDAKKELIENDPERAAQEIVKKHIEARSEPEPDVDPAEARRQAKAAEFAAKLKTDKSSKK